MSFSCIPIRARKLWGVRRHGNRRNLKRHESREVMWELTKALAQQHGAVAYLHDDKGRVVLRIEPRQDP